ncbi:hypothetical protein CsatA_002860 [Cannabis sativa]
MLFKLVLLFHPLLLLSNHHPFVNSVQPFCHDEERNALIHFNQSFKIHCQPRVDTNGRSVLVHPKTSTWGSNGTNYCAWDGVECDLVTGHVTGLNLIGSCLYGSIHSNNTLFHLVHLQKLHLGYNNFTFSPIPTTIAIFSELTFLHLGYSFFQGEIPSELSLLSKLSYLFLSGNVDGNDQLLSSLKLQKMNLGRLAKNLTTLSTLILNYVDMRYELGDSLANLSSSLTVLQLLRCGLYGPIPSSIGKLSQLNFITLDYNSFAGYIPHSFQNLTLLSTIILGNTQISGTIPSWLGNLTELTSIFLSSNNLTGSVPPSLSNIKNLEFLHLSENSLSGTLKFDSFLKLKNLRGLGLGHNMISLLLNEERKRELNTTLPKLEYLSLASCNLSRFPDFIVHQNNLAYLDLSDNNIYGPIPKDLMNSSLQSLEAMDLSYNWITGFQNYTTIPWSNLRAFYVQSNLLQGELPIPPSSIMHYDVSNNILSGQIPSLICNLSSIWVLELSNNNFSGEFPLCSDSGISESILVLNLRNNSFHGTIPLQCQLESKLRMVDFSHNHFQGKLQPPFTICMNLEYLDFSFNQLSDVFPTWLGSFPQLRVVLMRENKFHGVIGNPQNTTSEFAMLQIIDLSHNYFTGAIPFEYMLSWNAMKDFKMTNLTYMNTLEFMPDVFGSEFYENEFYEYDYSTTFVLKSVATHYGKIPMNLAVIDLSSNNFSGQIPEIIGNLKALYSLNLSNNALNGRIPPSLGTLTELESLDLSQNQLSGEIPQQLTDLKFLQKFDVSYNNLTGLIPRENQFHTFENNSFEGNQGVCGEPLSKKCQDSLLPPSASNQDDDSDSGIELDWKFILAGLVSGLFIGVSIGEMLIPRTRLAWFVYISRTRLREMMIRN